ncbi:hypothetical protein NBH00_07480 [Paraconexibacter antarcticus]|uniref:SPOR domain-containing protein n=1 Tax=Paraconexibacter antarcticus TaxID=2949664 RepID=A0ABY5DVJ8_9ACTN|nr:hypothetical protein [Paraconexibacter antarcticus]UTI66036.1 hypothetical protein NBH00_07480 [Paraconexibacter antarcticus]
MSTDDPATLTAVDPTVYVVVQDERRGACLPVGVYSTEAKARAAASTVDRFYGEPRIHAARLDAAPAPRGGAM